MDTVKTGIVGLGNMGFTHARNILDGKIPGMELAAVSDVVESNRARITEVPTYADCSEMIQSGKIDALIIATPHFFHTTIGIEALGAGLHVLTEKPLSVHKADCERLLAAHTSDKQVFAAMFNQRTDPHYKVIKDLIEGGELGAVRRVVWNITHWFRTESYYASGGWRATWKGEGGGVLINQCPHQLDLWQWLFGMPEKVRAFVSLGRYHDIEVEDDVTAYLEYANGCKGVFITTTGEAPGSNRLEVTAERGKLVLEDDGDIFWTRNTTPMSEFSAKTTAGFAKPDTWDVRIPVSGVGGQHNEILQNFTNAILHGAHLLSPAAEGIHSVELGNAMLYSGLNDATVNLPLDGAAFETMMDGLVAKSNYDEKMAKAKNIKASTDDFSKSFR